MEIKEEEYIRAKDGTIGKVIEKKENPDRYVIDDYGQIILENYIVKHNKKLIDIIELGDYVNGNRINSIQLAKVDNGEIIKRLICQLNIYDSPIIYEDKDIKSIVTKEQFTSIEYKI